MTMRTTSRWMGQWRYRSTHY